MSVLHKAAWLERLLAEGVSKTKQADGGIHEDQLLNFLVNRLDEEVSLSLANNAEITAEDIYEGPRRRLRRQDLSPRSVRRARTHPLGTRSSTIFGRSSSRNSSNESLTAPAKGSR